MTITLDWGDFDQTVILMNISGNWTGQEFHEAIHDFINKAKNIGKEWDDLDDQEMQELRDEFGDQVNDPNWQLLFNSLLGVSVAIDRIAESRKEAA